MDKKYRSYTMTKDEWAIFKNDAKRFQYYANYVIKCQCGHSNLIKPKYEWVACSFCHRKIFRDKELQEEYNKKIKEENKKLKAYKFRKELMKRL